MPDASAGPARLLILGVGSRGGHAYAGWCRAHPEAARVVAIADLDADRRQRVGDAHQVPPRFRFDDWRAALAYRPSAFRRGTSESAAGRPGPWDAVVVATPDRVHVDPAIRALDLGFDVLLEKPIAPTAPELDRLAAATKDRPGAVTVGHVMRYTPFFKAIRRLLDSGRIGQLQGIQHTEHIAYWHFAHSYVRGNWHRADRSSPMLLAKACHDLDLLRWLVGEPFVAVSSFGRRRNFRAENAPPGSTQRCTDGCAVATTCPYNAERFYLEQLAGVHGPPVTAITNDTSPAGRRRALQVTDYGRCVYRMDNDVVDHQTTALEFANGVTASLVVSAFTYHNTRTLTLMGSHGQIDADLRTGRIETTAFLDALPLVDAASRPSAFPESATGRHASGGSGTLRVGSGSGTQVEDVSEAFGGHAGGDAGLMADFTERVRRRRDGFPVDAAPSALEESLESHRVAFAAERARLNGTVELL